LIGLIAPGVIGAVVSSGVGVNFHNSPANEKQGLIPEETSQTLLTNKSKETWTSYIAAKINKPPQTRTNLENYTYYTKLKKLAASPI
jgi:hypothetical protein